MRIYLSSPVTQHQAEYCVGRDVLLSYAVHRNKGKVVAMRYAQTFRHILIDSGAYSALNSGVSIDIEEYRAWAEPWRPQADAIAGLDDIGGDWRTSLRNYATIPWTFPTYHDTDPPELLDELVAMARERNRWLGVGLKPPRHGKEAFVRATFERIPTDIYVHGWALGGRYGHLRRMNSTDSTAWFRVAMRLNGMPALQNLTFGECLDLSIRLIERKGRKSVEADQLVESVMAEEV